MGRDKLAHARFHTRRIYREYRYEVCGGCGLEWNVSKQLTIPWYGYRCPRCTNKWRRITGTGGNVDGIYGRWRNARKTREKEETNEDHRGS